MNKILTFALALVLVLQLSTAVSAFSPPSPVPLLAQVTMGGGPVPDLPVRVEILDSVDGHVHDSAVYITDNTDSAKGQLFFDLGEFKGCRGPYPDYPDYTIEGKCYTLPMRGYAGDNIRFTFVYQELNYQRQFALADVLSRVGDKKVAELVFADAPAPPVIPPPTPTEPVKQFVCSDGSTAFSASDCPVVPPVVEEVYKCADGTEVKSLDDCPLTKTNVVAIMTGAGIGGAVAIGFAALVAYYYRKGQKARARKMLATFIKKKQKR